MENDERTQRFLAYLSEHDMRLRGYILSLVPHWNDAQEVFQEVQLRLWQQFDDFDATKDFGAWACTIAYYFVLALRKEHSHRRLILSEPVLEKLAQRGPPPRRAAEARYSALMDCLDKLHQSKRSIIMRYYAGEESGSQLAESLGKSFDALRQIVLRTRKTLARCVDMALRKEDQP